MSAPQLLDDRCHAAEFLKVLDSWLALRLVSRTRLHILARFEPADEQTAQANAILTGLLEHGRAAARFVASQTGGSESGTVLWWVQSQLADDYSRDNDSASRFADVRLIVDNAILQVEAATAAEVGFMRMAIEEARKSVAEDGRDHPRVGTVVVMDGMVLATAHRGEMGEGDHAEFTALEKKLPDEKLAGATVYATLEPCTYRSPKKIPCAQRLIDRKVKRVVIGMLDPNPHICGKGERMLRDRGIVVDRFPHDLILELEEINRAFVKAQYQAASVPPSPPSSGGSGELRDLQRRFVDAQDRFPREISFALAMVPYDERRALEWVNRRFNDMLSGPPQAYGWRCLASAGGGDTPETILIPASERIDGGGFPLHYNLDSWQCWLLRQSTTAPYPDSALNMFHSLATDACRLLDLRDCGMMVDGRHLKGGRGEYQHLLRWSVEKLSPDECRKWTWLDAPNERVRTPWRPNQKPRRWMVEMPCVFAAVALAINRHLKRSG